MQLSLLQAVIRCSPTHKVGTTKSTCSASTDFCRLSTRRFQRLFASRTVLVGTARTASSMPYLHIIINSYVSINQCISTIYILNNRTCSGTIWHNGTSLVRKDILICFAGSFLRFRQLVADVCIGQWPN